MSKEIKFNIKAGETIEENSIQFDEQIEIPKPDYSKVKPNTKKRALSHHLMFSSLYLERSKRVLKELGLKHDCSAILDAQMTVERIREKLEEEDV